MSLDSLIASKKQIKQKRETFAEYAKLNRGVPYLVMNLHDNKKTASVSWDAGMLWDEHIFKVALDSKLMKSKLMDIFHKIPQEYKKAEYGRGEIVGHMTCIPIESANLVFETVAYYFNCALHTMIRHGVNGNENIWDEASEIVKSIKAEKAKETDHGEEIASKIDDVVIKQRAMGNKKQADLILTAETLQSITYRAFELAESAIKAAIAQAIEEQFND